MRPVYELNNPLINHHARDSKIQCLLVTSWVILLVEGEGIRDKEEAALVFTTECPPRKEVVYRNERSHEICQRYHRSRSLVQHDSPHAQTIRRVRSIVHGSAYAPVRRRDDRTLIRRRRTRRGDLTTRKLHLVDRIVKGSRLFLGSRRLFGSRLGRLLLGRGHLFDRSRLLDRGHLLGRTRVLGSDAFLGSDGLFARRRRRLGHKVVILAGRRRRGRRAGHRRIVVVARFLPLGFLGDATEKAPLGRSDNGNLARRARGRRRKRRGSRGSPLFLSLLAELALLGKNTMTRRTSHGFGLKSDEERLATDGGKVRDAAAAQTYLL